MAGRILVTLSLAAVVGCGTTRPAETRPAAGAASASEAQPGRAPRKVVVLRLQIGDDGAVRDVRVVRSAGRRFDQAASRAATRARFEPPREDGRPIESTLIMTYRFKP